MDQIVLFGDSITQQSANQERGFAFKAALEDAYIRRLDVVNRGYSGYNTVQALKVLPKIIPPVQHGKIRLLTIFFGANDARLPDTPGFSQTVSLEEYRTNMIRLATHPALAAHRPQIMLVTPPPIDERLCEICDREKGINVTRRTAVNTARYAQTVRDIGNELDLPVLDIWSAFMKEAGWKKGDILPGSKSIDQNPVLVNLMHDGLHFTPDGYKILFKEFMSLVRTVLPDLEPEKIPFVLPPWDDADAWIE